MVAPAIGAVVLIPFPFSDLSRSKLRPALVLANAERADRILCQITSKQYQDSRAIPLSDADFAEGSLRVRSYARPGKLFTAHESLITSLAGKLKPGSFSRTLDAVIAVLRASAPG